jgi:hypothetical protein
MYPDILPTGKNAKLGFLRVFVRGGTRSEAIQTKNNDVQQPQKDSKLQKRKVLQHPTKNA